MCLRCVRRAVRCVSPLARLDNMCFVLYVLCPTQEIEAFVKADPYVQNGLVPSWCAGGLHCSASSSWPCREMPLGTRGGGGGGGWGRRGLAGCESQQGGGSGAGRTQAFRQHPIPDVTYPSLSNCAAHNNDKAGVPVHHGLFRHPLGTARHRTTTTCAQASCGCLCSSSPSLVDHCVVRVRACVPLVAAAYRTIKPYAVVVKALE